jgi:predicted transcriptional regulator
MIIEEFMSRNLEYASMTDSLLQAVRKITDKNVSSLVVVDMNNIPIGPVTGGNRGIEYGLVLDCIAVEELVM